MSAPVPSPKLQDVLSQFGALEGEFRPPRRQIVGGLALGVLLVAVGVATVILTIVTGQKFGVLFGAFLIVCGGGLIWWLQRFLGQALFVCSVGLVRTRRTSINAFAWEEVREFVEVVDEQKRPLKRMRIVLKRGHSLSLDNLQAGAIKKLMALLKQKAEQHSIPWNVDVYIPSDVT
jgi:hypothetical protein